VPFYVLLAFVTLLGGCGLWYAAYDKHLVGPYRLGAIDVLEQMSVYYDLGNGSEAGRIDETVFSVGWNEHFIVAKQHPKNDRKVTNFFVLSIEKDSINADPSASVSGPLTEVEFKRRKSELKLPDFTTTFWTLE